MTDERPLDVERLARAMDDFYRAHHDPEHGRYHGMDNDETIAIMTREEAAEIAENYARPANPDVKP